MPVTARTARWLQILHRPQHCRGDNEKTCAAEDGAPQDTSRPAIQQAPRVKKHPHPARPAPQRIQLDWIRDLGSITDPDVEKSKPFIVPPRR